MYVSVCFKLLFIVISFNSFLVAKWADLQQATADEDMEDEVVAIKDNKYLYTLMSKYPTEGVEYGSKFEWLKGQLNANPDKNMLFFSSWYVP